MGLIDRLTDVRRILVTPHGPTTVTRQGVDMHVSLSTDQGTVKLCFPEAAWRGIASVLSHHATQITQERALQRMFHNTDTREASALVAEDRDYEVMRCRMRDRVVVAIPATSLNEQVPATCAMYDRWAYEDEANGIEGPALTVVQLYRNQQVRRS